MATSTQGRRGARQKQRGGFATAVLMLAARAQAGSSAPLQLNPPQSPARSNGSAVANPAPIVQRPLRRRNKAGSTPGFAFPPPRWLAGEARSTRFEADCELCPRQGCPRWADRTNPVRGPAWPCRATAAEQRGIDAAAAPRSRRRGALPNDRNTSGAHVNSENSLGPLVTAIAEAEVERLQRAQLPSRADRTASSG